ncbi:hypothetical protein FNU76_02245 [Chitinimonas arctica]|uniref:Uncharacterized protein n=1 Tax=Chitinimonas arctica TaxID=2594795 RepID=A0A516SAU4_9NEIS|nr:hypothetical protein [Chitinimonas arctica]QDQ25265.1 hypothetical protein FNU76_02245 [Chitinimonas arctica]
MLEAGFEFENNIARVVAAFETLPVALRPVYFSHTEEVSNAADQIEDKKRFAAFVAKSQSGFFLLAPGITYSIRIATGKSTICDCFLDVDPSLAKEFLIHMATAQPIFGFACEPQEREHRNRVVTKQGVNTIESWVGRDSQKYLPGFYWLTLLPDSLATRHAVPLPVVEKAAQEHVALQGGQHLFRFYEQPQDWQSVQSIAELISTLPGVFDIEKMKPQLAAAKNFLDLNAALRNWK